MPYSKTKWVDDSTPARSAANLNHQESGIYNAQALAEKNEGDIAAVSSGETPKGEFTPTGGTEYPVAPTVNDSWYIGGVAEAGYLYIGGDLAGKTANNMDKIIYTSTGWSLINVAFIAPTNTGFKNAIDNGDFGVQQFDDIDTAPIALIHEAYQIDRFISYMFGGGTGTIQRLLNQTVGGRYVNTVKCISTSTQAGTLGLYQKIEVFYNAETKTKGAWVKSNSANARIVVYDGVSFTSSSAHTGGGSYEFLSLPKTISDSATLLSAYVAIMAAGGSTVTVTTGDYIESTMWQLESGTVSSDFEQLKPSRQLANCQWHYEVLEGIIYGLPTFDSTTRRRNSLVIAPKRIVPAVTVTMSLGVDAGTSATTTVLYTAFTSTAASTEAKATKIILDSNL